MIGLSATTAAMLYLLMTLMTLSGIWGWHHYQSRKKKVILAAEELLVCEYCHCAYLGDIAKQVTQCPQCNCFNKQNKF